MNGKQACVGLFALGALAVGSRHFWQQGMATPKLAPNSEITSVLPTGVPRRTLAKPHRLVWTVGDTAVWHLEVVSRAGAASAAPAASLQASLHARVQNVSEGKVTLSLGLESPIYLAHGQACEAVRALLEASAAMVEMNLDGSGPKFTFPATVPAQDLNLLRLAYAWTFVVREESAYSLTETEPTSGGEQHCAYAWESDNQISKQRSAQTMPAGTPYEIRVLQSSFHGAPGHLWLASLDGSESCSLLMEENQVAEVHLTVKLRELPRSAVPKAMADMAGLSPEALAAHFASGTPGPSVQAALALVEKRQRWAGVPMSAVLEAVKAVAGHSLEEMTGPMEEMATWLAANPHELPALLAEIKATQDADLSVMLLNALRSSDPDLANAGLAAALRDPGSEASLMQSMVECGSLRGQADAGLIDELKKWHELGVTEGQHHLSDTAAFNLARIAKENPPTRQWLREQFLQDLAPASSPEDQVAALRMFANAADGDPQVLGRASALAGSKDPEVSSAALAYVGSLPPTTEHDALLLQGLASGLQDVRQAAAHALSHPGRPQTGPVQKALDEFAGR